MLAGSIANDKLAGSIANRKLANSSITIDGNSVSLGGSVTTNNTQLTQNVEDFVGGMLDEKIAKQVSQYHTMIQMVI